MSQEEAEEEEEEEEAEEEEEEEEEEEVCSRSVYSLHLPSHCHLEVVQSGRKKKIRTSSEVG